MHLKHDMWFQPVITRWQRLTAPLVGLSTSEQRRAELLASLLLTTLLGLAGGCLLLWLAAGQDIANNLYFRGALLCLLPASLSYLLSRYGRFNLALGVIVAQGFTSVYIVSLLEDARLNVPTLYFLTATIVFASPFISIFALVGLFGVQFLLLLVAPLLSPALDPERIVWGPGLFAFFVMLILVVVNDYRNRLERQRQRELGLSEERYRAISESLSDYAYGGRYDLQSGVSVEWATDSLKRITGYTLDEVRQQADPLFLYHPDERARVRQDMGKVMAGQGHTSEYRILRKDGEMRWIRIHRHPTKDGRFYAVGQDITERLRSQEALRSLAAEMEQQARLLDDILAATTDMIGVFNREGALTYVNRAGLEMFDFELDDVVGRPLMQLASNPANLATWQRIVNNVMRAFETSQPLTAEFTLSPSGGRAPHDFEAIFSPTHDPDEQTVSVVVVARDITLRRQEEAQKLKLALERERLSVLSKFFQAISHDFRTSLSIIETNRYLLQIQLSQDIETTPLIDKRLQRIQEHVLRLSAQLDNLGVINALTTPRPMPCDLNVLATDVAEAQRPLALAKQQTLTVEIAPGLPSVMGDCRELQRALGHLVTNAINYTPEHGSITIRTRLDGQFIAAEVCDSGIGIAPEHQQAIFDLFYRVDDARSIHDGGVGLGLSITQMIVDAHGGRLSVQSAPGEGSVFTLRLPLPYNEAVAPMLKDQAAP